MVTIRFNGFPFFFVRFTIANPKPQGERYDVPSNPPLCVARSRDVGVLCTVRQGQRSGQRDGRWNQASRNAAVTDGKLGCAMSGREGWMRRKRLANGRDR